MVFPCTVDGETPRKKNGDPEPFGSEPPSPAAWAYLFLWRCAFMRLSYLCFDIFFRRFFLMEPIVDLL